MRIIIAGDRSWYCPELEARVVKRLIARYGKEGLVIVYGAATGVDAAFDRAATLARGHESGLPRPPGTAWLWLWITATASCW